MASVYPVLRAVMDTVRTLRARAVVLAIAAAGGNVHADIHITIPLLCQSFLPCLNKLTLS